MKKDTQEDMVNTSILHILLKAAAMSTKIRNGMPSSILLIANSGMGKSSLINTLKLVENTIHCNDLSYKVVVENVLPELQNHKKTLLIPDFINLISHKKAFESLHPLLSALMAEGVKDGKFYGAKFSYKEELNANIIGAITRYHFERHITKWKETGFLSRMICVTYSHSKQTETLVCEFIKAEKQIRNRLNLPKTKVKIVKIPRAIDNELQEYCMKHIENNKYYTSVEVLANKRREKRLTNVEYNKYRFFDNMRSILKGICLLNKKGVVDYDDYNELLKTFKYINWDYNEI